ncbi:MAG TPA: hypothetical protein DHW02_06195 [Ktedonobacter sp.]|nr:hypothetical protein [Ktedonobacter sp.]
MHYTHTIRLPWLWPTILIISTLATGFVVFATPTFALRPFIVFWFLFVCPGMMLVRFLRLDGAIVQWTLAFATSFAVDALVACLLLYTGHWSMPITLSILMGLCLVGATIQLLKVS